MQVSKRNLILIFVLVLIVGAIAYLSFDSKSPAQITNEDSTHEIEIPNKVENSQTVKEKELKYPKAVELVKPDGFINSDNFTISQYIGKKVILVDFWTYSCINCVRTLPYLTSWYDKYEDDGLLIIGVHTPEFDFEKDYNNVKAAVEKYGIKYPVVQDNEMQTWRAYHNQYWPAEYLIDIDGFIVHESFGEGRYDEKEKAIQDALRERSERLGLGMNVTDEISQPNVSTPSFHFVNTPEIYFGYGFSRGQNGNEAGWLPGEIVSYPVPSDLDDGKFYLSGKWMNNEDNMESEGDGSIYLKYSAKQVNLVAGSDGAIPIDVYIDGEKVNSLTVNGYDLYTLYDGKSYGNHQIEIKTGKGLIAFTFTFG